ncbi:MAG: leucine-rich repeat protein [Clostridia bacterium]|nr:leucine-rich repeat protein [Clostridia bacterium]
MSRVKKILAGFVVAAMTSLSLFGGIKVNAAGSASGECGDNVRWSLDNGVMHISGKGDMNGYPVYNNPNSDLCMPWYEYKDQITSVIVDEGVTSVGTSAFWGCKNLKTLQTPTSLKEIGFAAFAECTALTDITIPSGIIGESAFIYDSSLINVNIGDKVTAMGISAFELCESVQKVNISSIEAWCNINFGGIASNPTCKSRKLYLNGKLVTDLVIPSEVTSVPSHAFEYLADIKSISIPSSVKSIGEYAFFMCNGISKITLNEGLEFIGANCFNGCNSVFEISIPASVVFIGNYAFSYLPIGSVSINKGVIAEYAFLGCGALGNVNIGSGVTKISNGAFNNCPALNSVVYGGSSEQWNAIEIQELNEALSGAQKTFNGTGAAPASPELTGFYVGKVFEFGTYEQDGNKDKAEPLNWIVLKNDGNKALVITEKVLEFRRFQDTIMALDTPWADSDIRKWLNNEFINDAFSDEEKARINLSTIQNKGNDLFDVSGTSDTQDKVFLLSADEAADLFTDDSMRTAVCTEYALIGNNEPAFRDANTGYSYWWLRTAGVNKYSAMFVDYNGVPLEFGMATANYIGGIRPAMWIDVTDLPYTDPAPSGKGNTEPTPVPGGDNTLTPVPLPTMPAAEMNVGDFVNRCYDVALSRSADEAGYEYWVSQLNNGQACGAQVGYGFIFGDEYSNKNTTNEQFVTDLYSMYFGRTPDEAGFAYWLDMLNNNISREVVFAGFANSLEFYNLCLNYGVVSGVYVTGVPNTQQGGVNSFVARLYKVCFGRLPDQSGQATWTQALIDGKLSGSGCAYGFIFSSEFTNRNLDNVAFVSYMYQAFFGREADTAGLTEWVQQLNAGASRETVYDGFKGSPEFANLCASYGIMP